MRRGILVLVGWLASGCGGQPGETVPPPDLDSARLAAMAPFVGFLAERTSVACAAFRDGRGEAQTHRDPAPVQLARLTFPDRTIVPVSQCEFRDVESPGRHWAHKGTGQRAVLLFAEESVASGGDVGIKAGAWWGMLGGASSECTFRRGNDGWEQVGCSSYVVSD